MFSATKSYRYLMMDEKVRFCRGPASNPREDYTIIEWTNENKLKKFVFKALDDHGMLSRRRVEPEEGLKDYTVQVYADDLGRYDGQVWFANANDVNKLMSILIDRVGRDRMHKIVISLEEPFDDIHEKCHEEYLKWRVGEDWPF